MRSLARHAAVLVVGLLVIAGLSACGGTVPPPEASPASARPAGETVSPEARDVEIFTSADRFVLQGFRIDFAKMRNIYSLIGFYPDRWEKMEEIPFSAIQEFEIRNPVDSSTFDRIYKDREDYRLNPQEIFRVYVRLKSGDTFDYIAIIPKIRGFRDGQKWEQAMAGNPLRIDRITIKG